MIFFVFYFYSNFNDIFSEKKKIIDMYYGFINSLRFKIVTNVMKNNCKECNLTYAHVVSMKFLQIFFICINSYLFIQIVNFS